MIPKSEPETGPHENGPLVLPAFGGIEPERVLAVDELFAVICDKFPISPGHTLIIPRRAVLRFADLSAEERVELLDWASWVQQELAARGLTPDGFNLGLNDGPAAGQTMPQFHFTNRNARNQCLGNHSAFCIIRPPSLGRRSGKQLHKPTGLHTELPMDNHRYLP